MINILCDRALLIAYGDEKRRITAGIVSRAIREILNLPQNRRQRTFAVATAVLLMMLAIAALIYTKQATIAVTAPVNGTSAASPPHSTAQPAAVPAKKLSSTDTQGTSLHKKLIHYDQHDFHVKAFNAIAEKWQERPIRIFGGKLTIPDMYRRLAVKRNLLITEYTGSLEQALAFNLPLLAVTTVTGDLGNYCLAITGQSGTTLAIAPQIDSRDSLTFEQLKPVLSGRFYLVWQNRGQIPHTLSSGDARYEIRTLQLLLQRAGSYQERIDGVYSAATIKAVQSFQRSHGITENPQLGELTLAALTRFDTSRPTPVLKKD
jgi:general secretion pathway protein A